MAKKKIKVINKPQLLNVENIDVFWDIPTYWNDLPYEIKLRYYWEFKYVGGVRDVSQYENYVPKIQHGTK